MSKSIFDMTDQERLDKQYRINRRLREHLSEALSSNPKIKDWFIIAANGSINYDLDYEDSDIDSKLLVIPDIHQLIWNDTHNYLHVMSDNEEHCEVKDVRNYFHTILKQNINFVETLFSDYVVVNPKYVDIWEAFLAMREEIAFYDPIAAMNCMVGMMRQKQIDMVSMSPGRKEAIEKYGYDVKNYHHIWRLHLFFMDYLKNYGDVNNQTPYKDCLVKRPAFLRNFLIHIKRGDDFFTAKDAKERADILYAADKELKDKIIEYYKNVDTKDYQEYIRTFISDTIEQLIDRSLH